MRSIESAEPLDEPAKAIAGAVRSNLSGTLKDAVSGTWLGHAVHPLLTDVVVGSFTSATVLDLLGGWGASAASRRLIGVGIAAYVPTALTGVSDWADSEPVDDGVRRAGLIHAAGNAAALTLYAGSLLARRRGAQRSATLLSVAGAAVLGSAGGYLGGYLTLSKGIGADQTVFDPGPREWTAVSGATEVPAGKPVRVVADETPVLLLRDGEQLLAIHDRCSHRGCSLSDGEIEGGEVVCGCHGSRFDLHSGAVRQGPATAPQPAFEVREREGRIELRLRSTVAA